MFISKVKLKQLEEEIKRLKNLTKMDDPDQSKSEKLYIKREIDIRGIVEQLYDEIYEKNMIHSSYGFPSRNSITERLKKEINQKNKEIQYLRNDIDKLKGIVNEVIDYVYSTKERKK